MYLLLWGPNFVCSLFSMVGAGAEGSNEGKIPWYSPRIQGRQKGTLRGTATEIKESTTSIEPREVEIINDWGLHGQGKGISSMFQDNILGTNT